MAETVRITFSGGRELARMLRELPAIVATEILETAVVAGAGILRQAIAERAPRGTPRRRPGTVSLADSFRVTVVERDRAHTVVHVGTKMRYGHLLEYGHQIIARGPSRTDLGALRRSVRTGQRGARGQAITVMDESTRRGLLRRALKERRARGSLGFVAARPFMRPAVDETREQVLRRIAEVLGVGITTAMRRQAQAA